MAFETPKIKYSGKIKEIKIGRDGKEIIVGGESSYPLYSFEGAVPNTPKIAIEVLDSIPEKWPDALMEHYKDVIASPSAWAKKCVEKMGAEIISLRLASTDPNGADRSADDIMPIVKQVMDSVDVPLIIWGCENDEKDAEVLPRIAELCHGKRIIIGPATDKNYKKIGAAAIAYGHIVTAATPIDVNLAKQLNILLGDLGVPADQIIMDMNVGGCSIGYGLEYTYSVMERQKQAALTQGDEKLQYPVLCNFANDVWRKREITLDDANMGNKNNRGILFEAITAWMHLLAGGNILVMRHPEAVKLIKSMINQLIQ